VILTRLRPRWWRRQINCALGRHGWMMGPFTAEGKWRDENGELQPIPADFTPYCCAFSSPWCKATKREPRDLLMLYHADGRPYMNAFDYLDQRGL
jgi:hypothetical protein